MKLLVVTPFHRTISDETESVLKYLEGKYLVWRASNCSAIDLCRSMIATFALDNHYDATLWIDSDIEISNEDIDEFILNYEIEKRNSFYFAPYLRKDSSYASLCLTYKGYSEEYLKNYRYCDTAACGFGCTLLGTDVLNGIQEKYKFRRCSSSENVCFIPYFLPMVVERNIDNVEVPSTYLTEDYAFCHRATSCGFKITTDRKPKVIHIGDTKLVLPQIDGFYSLEGQK